jgi:HTH-type transcriptional regulator / antitoxin HipB
MKKQLNITTLDELLDKQYGKRGTKKREEYEQGFEIFKLGVMLHQIRKDQGLTKKEVADKCGTSKAYIARIENNPD